MAISRTVKIQGLAFATEGNVNAAITINDVQCFSGPVATTITENVPLVISDTTSGDLPQTLNTFSLSLDVTGNVDLSITATGGTLIFSHFLMNYTFPAGYIDEETGNFVVTTNVVENFEDPNENDTVGVYDGKVNIQIDGEPAVLNQHIGRRGGSDGTDTSFMGDAPILIPAGSTMTCTYGILVNNFPA